MQSLRVISINPPLRIHWEISTGITTPVPFTPIRNVEYIVEPGHVSYIYNGTAFQMLESRAQPIPYGQVFGDV